MTSREPKALWVLREALRKGIGACLVGGLIGFGPAAISQGVQAGPRFALVIANSDYATPSDALPGAARDAGAIREALLAQGFEVKLVRNARNADIKAAVDAFARSLKQGGPAAIGFVYYAGHGGADRSGDRNFLVPADVPNVAVADFGAVGYPVEDVFSRLAQLDARAAIAIVIDACRSTSAGSIARLAPPVEQEKGFLLAHSTRQGAPASDSGLFAEALARNLVAPGLDLEGVFDNVRREVVSRNSLQEPTHRSQLTKRVCLAGCTTGRGQGKYAANPQLLMQTQADADRLWADLVRLRAEERCASGFNSTAALRASASAARTKGDDDTAGETLEAVIQRAGQIGSELSALDSAIEARQRYARQLAQQNANAGRAYYETLGRQAFDRSYAEAVRWAKTPKLESDVRRILGLREEASRLAAREQYFDAGDRLVDAINLANQIEEEANANRYRLSRRSYMRRPDADVDLPVVGVAGSVQPGSICR